MIPNLWDDIQLLETTIIALLGGLMGTMFTIALKEISSQEALLTLKALHVVKYWSQVKKVVKVRGYSLCAGHW